MKGETTVKKETAIKFTGIVIGLAYIFFVLTACSLFYDGKRDAESGFFIGCSSFYKECFVGDYQWDGSEEGKNIIVPDTYKTYPVTELGGYFGRGVPTPFFVSLPEEYAISFVTDCEPTETPEWYPQGYEVVNLTFRLNIGKNLQGVFYTGNPYHARENGDGSYTLFCVSYYVTCSSENSVFYCEEGRLYRKNDRSLVEELRYQAE